MHNKKKKSSGSSATKAKGFGGGMTSSKQQDRFPYAGSIRPGKQTPQRIVTVDSIVQPDYATTGTPGPGAFKPMLPWMIEVKTADEILKMKMAGAMAREILDLAGRAVAVGVTTDEIDALVHEEIVKVCI